MCWDDDDCGPPRDPRFELLESIEATASLIGYTGMQDVLFYGLQGEFADSIRKMFDDHRDLVGNDDLRRCFAPRVSAVEQPFS